MLRMRCARQAMPSGSSCKVKGPSPPEGVGWGGSSGQRRYCRITAVLGDWENVGFVGAISFLMVTDCCCSSVRVY